MTASAGSVRRRTRPGGPDAAGRGRLAATRDSGGEGTAATGGGAALVGAAGLAVGVRDRVAWGANHPPDSSKTAPSPSVTMRREGGRSRIHGFETLAAARESRASGSGGS